MSNVFFFRLHKLRRRREEQQRQLHQQQQIRLSSSSSAAAAAAAAEDAEGLGDGSKRRGTLAMGRGRSRFRRLTRPSFHCPSLLAVADRSLLTSTSSSRSNNSNHGGAYHQGRLFERPTNLDPSDSLDCIALQIPRSVWVFVYFSFLFSTSGSR